MEKDRAHPRCFDFGTTAILTAAFDEAWLRLQAEVSTLASPHNNAIRIREMLALRIIELAEYGERDVTQLTADACAHVMRHIKRDAPLSRLRMGALQ